MERSFPLSHQFIKFGQQNIFCECLSVQTNFPWLPHDLDAQLEVATVLMLWNRILIISQHFSLIVWNFLGKKAGRTLATDQFRNFGCQILFFCCISEVTGPNFMRCVWNFLVLRTVMQTFRTRFPEVLFPKKIIFLVMYTLLFFIQPFRYRICGRWG